VKIAILSSYYPLIGGAEVFAQEVAEYVATKVGEADVITLHPDKSLSKFELINNVTVHRIGVSRIGYLRFLGGFLRLLWHVLKLNKARNYDLIHSVQDGIFCYVGTCVKRLTGRPHLITIQGGNISAGFKNDLSGKILCKLQKWSFKNADWVHVISRSLAQESERLGAKNIAVLPNGINSRLFKPMDKEKIRRKYSLSPKEKIVVSVARLAPVKGVDCLIRAIGLLVENISALRLIVIGDGKQRMELEQLIDQLHLNNKVQLLGFIPHEQILEYLNMADVFVLPSRHEGLGIALIEAMACGIPVIGSNVDGIVDLIEHEKNGILFPPNDEKELARALDKLLQDENLRRAFIEEGLEKVKENFLWSSILPKIEDIYTELVQDKKEAKAFKS